LEDLHLNDLEFALFFFGEISGRGITIFDTNGELEILSKILGASSAVDTQD
jgi:hypothetical protein